MAISLKVGEAKTIRFRLNETAPDGTQTPVDVSAATLTLEVVDSAEASAISKADIDFDKSQGAAGIVTVPFSTTDTAQTPGQFKGELKIEFSGTNIDKSADFDLEFVRALTT